MCISYDVFCCCFDFFKVAWSLPSFDFSFPFLSFFFFFFFAFIAMLRVVFISFYFALLFVCLIFCFPFLPIYLLVSFLVSFVFNLTFFLRMILSLFVCLCALLDHITLVLFSCFDSLSAAGKPYDVRVMHLLRDLKLIRISSKKHTFIS